jgi:hypothetical protein
LPPVTCLYEEIIFVGTISVDFAERDINADGAHPSRFH